MNRILKNTSTAEVNTIYQGRKYHIQPKGSLTLKPGKDGEAATYLLQTYGFLKDITPKTTYPVKTKGTETVEIKRANGTVKKVTRPKIKAEKARGKKVK